MGICYSVDASPVRNRVFIKGGGEQDPDQADITSRPEKKEVSQKTKETETNKATASKHDFSENKTVIPLLAKLQTECWNGYVSTGRGCHTLFQLVDTDSNGVISWKELNFFLQNVRSKDINPAAKKDLLTQAADGNLNFNQFQSWLIKATKVDPGLDNAYATEHYNKSLGKTERPMNYSWNKDSMSQNLRRMQYAVRGEVVFRADACKYIYLWIDICLYSFLPVFFLT